MKNIDLMKSGEMHYFHDDEIIKLQLKAKMLLEQFNNAPCLDFKTRDRALRKLLGKIDGWCCINAPFRCDYGKFIELGNGVFINYDCVILDACTVKIGDNVLIGPKTCIYSVSHPIDAEVRASGFDTSKPVTICKNAWLGGNVVVNPGVTIGEGSIIGAGSVVTKDIPPNVIAAGNPCRVLREITEEDKKLWQAKKEEYLKEHEIHVTKESLSNSSKNLRIGKLATKIYRAYLNLTVK